MAKKLSRREIENWLYDARKVSQDERPAVQKHLAEHPEITDYVEEKKAQRKPDAKDLDRRVRMYAPKSFKISKTPKHTFTFSTEHKAAKIMGYILAAAIAAFTIYLGYQVYKYSEQLVEEFYERIYKEMD